MEKIKVLEIGQSFKFVGKRKFNKVLNIVPVPDGSGQLEHKGRLIITVEGCKQYILPPDYEIIIQREKLITFTMVGPGGNWVVDQEAKNLLDIVFGCNADRRINAETIKSAYPDLEDGEEMVFKFKVQKIYSQAELDAMPEFDGDI